MKKYSKGKANYRMARGKRKCNNCDYYNRKSRTCSKVDGYISPDATCNYWK